MKNVLIFQPYLSNRKLSSNTVERQFRFLKYSNNKVYAVLGIDEIEYADYLRNTDWVRPIIVDFNEDIKDIAKMLIDTYEPTDIFISRTYCTPSTKDDEIALKYNMYEPTDIRFRRNRLPVDLADLCLPVHHMIYDPLELKYDDIIPAAYYTKHSSMNNVDGTKPHLFADLGYYDVFKEVRLEDKKYLFTFGATSVEPNRSEQIRHIYNSLHDRDCCNVYVRIDGLDNLVPNEEYEDKTSKSLFTYTLPSYSPIHMSFTRMLLALSQNTIPLIHPDNNLDCLFGEGFEVRESLKDFFNRLIMSPEDLEAFLHKENLGCASFYQNMLDMWHDTEYYNWLHREALRGII